MGHHPWVNNFKRDDALSSWVNIYIDGVTHGVKLTPHGLPTSNMKEKVPTLDNIK
mgnify:CR=1 FL=1